MANWFDDLLGANYAVGGIHAVRRMLVNPTNFYANDDPANGRYNLFQFGAGAPVPSIKYWCQAAPAVNADRWTDAQGVIRTAPRPIVVPVAFGASTITWICTGNTLLTDTVTFTVQKNGVDTSLVLAIAPGTLFYTPQASMAGFVNWNAGDTIDLKIRQNGTAVQANWFSQLIIGGV
jgi:hypothetical protein